jgi:hypothetical protein
VSDQSPPRDPSTKAKREKRPEAGIRHYASGDLSLSIRGLEGSGPVRIHLEHKSGAALIDPFCAIEDLEQGRMLSTQGFDGTGYRITIDEARATAQIEASAPSEILGGAISVVLPRGEDLASGGPLRITGDEDTMPITVRKG